MVIFQEEFGLKYNSTIKKQVSWRPWDQLENLLFNYSLQKFPSVPVTATQ